MVAATATVAVVDDDDGDFMPAVWNRFNERELLLLLLVRYYNAAPVIVIILDA
jgi:hypothetical protein